MTSNTGHRAIKLFVRFQYQIFNLRLTIALNQSLKHTQQIGTIFGFSPDDCTGLYLTIQVFLTLFAKDKMSSPHRL